MVGHHFNQNYKLLDYESTKYIKTKLTNMNTDILSNIYFDIHTWET